MATNLHDFEEFVGGGGEAEARSAVQGVHYLGPAVARSER